MHYAFEANPALGLPEDTFVVRLAGLIFFAHPLYLFTTAEAGQAIGERHAGFMRNAFMFLHGHGHILIYGLAVVKMNIYIYTTYIGPCARRTSIVLATISSDG